MSHTTDALICEDLGKYYPRFHMDKVNLHIEQGTVMGLVGPNGAGKSTLLRMVMGLIAPNSGRLEVLGYDMQKQPSEAKFNIGFVSEDMRLYESKSIGFHMEFVKLIFPSWDDHYARTLLKIFDLNVAQKVKGLSHGQRVKASLLLALARRPSLLVLDEPTMSLDPSVRKEVLDELMKTMEDETRTILFSSHNTLDVEQIADYITFLYDGKVLESKDKESFLEGWRRIRLKNATANDLPDLNNIMEVQGSGSLLAVVVNNFDEGVPQKLIGSGCEVEAIERMTLEEIFLSQVQHAKRSLV